MVEKRFSVKKSGSGLFYRDGNYEINNTIQFIIETVEMKLNQLYDENEQLKQFKEKVFTLIDKEIARNEEAIEWGKETGVDCGSIGFYNYMLNRLKRELQE